MRRVEAGRRPGRHLRAPSRRIVATSPPRRRAFSRGPTRSLACARATGHSSESLIEPPSPGLTRLNIEAHAILLGIPSGPGRCARATNASRSRSRRVPPRRRKNAATRHLRRRRRCKQAAICGWQKKHDGSRRTCSSSQRAATTSRTCATRRATGITEGAASRRSAT